MALTASSAPKVPESSTIIPSGIPLSAAMGATLSKHGPHRGARCCTFSSATRRPIGKISANVARFRLYRHRFLQVNTRFAAFFKIYQIIKLKFLKFGKILEILRHLQIFC